MSRLPSEPVEADIDAWIDRAEGDSTLHLARRVGRIVLAAIGLSPRLGGDLVLKGGTLMAIAFGSMRSTSDLDFTASSEIDSFEEMLRDELDQAMRRARLELGELALECSVQAVDRKPPPQRVPDPSTPALEIKVGCIVVGPGMDERKLERQRDRLRSGRVSDIVQIDVSFRDKVHQAQDIRLTNVAATIRAFTAEELIAEKLRALLQQAVRQKKGRRQDVFDIAHLLSTRTFDDIARADILNIMVEKCRIRDIRAEPNSMDNPEVRRKAGADWDTLEMELEDLPDFDTLFEQVRSFYAGLPWPTIR